MSRNRVNYPVQAMFAGPSPATGECFMFYDGQLNNEYDNLGANHNLLQQINRIQDASFSIEAERKEIRQLGTKSLVGRPAIDAPQINLQFSYLLNGIANDMRLGLNCNYGQYFLNHSGDPYYADNYNVSLLSGLIARQFGQPTGEPYWPMPMRDNRNIFLVRAPEHHEVLREGYQFDVPDTTREVNQLAPEYEVLAFGQCYLDSYETFGAVNAFPTSRVSFSCENVCFYLSGSGCNIPAINTATRQLINQNKFNIPEARDEGGPSILNPGDIRLDITEAGGGNISGMGINLNDATITSYSINIDFKRDLLTSLGHKCPLDREITFPIIANLTFDMVVGDLQDGHFIDLLNRDSGYNVDLKLRNSPHVSPFPIYGETSKQGTAGTAGLRYPRHAGPATTHGLTAIHYAFRNAIFESVNFTTAIGNNKTAELNFSVEIDPDDFSKGLFISGLLNIEKTEDYLIDDEGWVLVDENSNPIVTNIKQLF